MGRKESNQTKKVEWDILLFTGVLDAILWFKRGKIVQD